MTPRHSFFTEHMGVTRSKKDLYHRWSYSHLQRVFSISGETYHRNLKALPLDKSKITKLWLGTDIPSQHLYKQHEIDSIKIELGLPLDSLIIGNIGRICEGKGQHNLLEAFSLIQHKYLILIYYLLVVSMLPKVQIGILWTHLEVELVN